MYLHQSFNYTRLRFILGLSSVMKQSLFDTHIPCVRIPSQERGIARVPKEMCLILGYAFQMAQSIIHLGGCGNVRSHRPQSQLFVLNVNLRRNKNLGIL